MSFHGCKSARLVQSVSFATVAGDCWLLCAFCLNPKQVFLQDHHALSVGNLQSTSESAVAAPGPLVREGPVGGGSKGKPDPPEAWGDRVPKQK